MNDIFSVLDRSALKDVAASHESFFAYANDKLGKGLISRSLERGSFFDLEDVLDEHAHYLLGEGQTGLSSMYGHAQGEPALREKIADLENLKCGTRYTAEDVVMTSGVWPSPSLIVENAREVKEAGTVLKVAIIGPNYLHMFNRILQMPGVETSCYCFCHPEYGHLPRNEADLEAVLAAGQDIVFLTNPSNPDGLYLPEPTMRRFVELCGRYNTLLVIDEVQDFYGDPDGPGLGYKDWIGSSWVVRLDSYSKKAALAGYRVGWLMTQNTGLCRPADIVKIQQGINGNAPRAANDCIDYLLDQDRKDFNREPNLFSDARERLIQKERVLVDGLRRIGDQIDIFPRDAGFNRAITVNGVLTDMELTRRLAELGTLVMPGSLLGYDPKDTVLRLTFTAPDEVLHLAVEDFEEVVSRL